MSKKQPIKKEKIKSKKMPITSVDGHSYLNKNPLWSFKRCDREKWSLLECEGIHREITDKLISFEGMTWGEILKASGARRAGTNNHYETVDDFILAAQRRAVELKVDGESFFSLHLNGKLRLYGIIDDGVYNIIWCDPNHEICLSRKRNT